MTSPPALSPFDLSVLFFVHRYLAMLVTMAIVSTLMATPIFERVYGSKESLLRTSVRSIGSHVVLASESEGVS